MEGVEAEGWETLVKWLVSDGQLTERSSGVIGGGEVGGATTLLVRFGEVFVGQVKGLFQTRASDPIG
jgi:hypothetical protein